MYPRDFTKLLRHRLAEGRAFDDALRDLRAAGASIVESIVAVKRVRACDLGEAKELVHHSVAWADVSQAAEEMWAGIAEELEREAKVGGSPNDGSIRNSGNLGASSGPPSHR